MHRDVVAVLDRVRALGTDNSYLSDRRSLIHAYIACLSLSALCTAIAATLDAPVIVRLALRGRLLRLLAAGVDDRAPVVELVETTAAVSDRDRNLRRAADALHGAVFDHLPVRSQQMLLNRWVDRGGTGAMARWLKAVKANQRLFEASTALSYWRASGDFRAAKALAYQASPEILRAVVPEFVAKGEEGWIVSKAIMRCGDASGEVWDKLRASYPASYLYLCARLGRPVSDDEALELVHRCEPWLIANDRGLAIWAIGQMGKLTVLDRIVDAIEVFRQRDIEYWKRRYG